jgi:hypothetical protein
MLRFFRHFPLMILVLFISCGKKSSSSCDNSKAVFSTWTSDTSGNIFAMQGVTYNQTFQVLFGAAPCDDGRGDFTMFVAQNGRAGFANCADTVALDAANWKKSCNTLKLTYDSDSSVEVFR